ncbi:MAG: glutaredoxin [Candidatus Omnitrophota bacterium]
MPELILYVRDGCPYCRKVLQFLEGQKLTVPLKKISDSEKIRSELISLGGKSQVPCLSIDGKPLYESDDIIEWFKKSA